MNPISVGSRKIPLDLCAAIEHGCKIKAIKLLREHSGPGLKQSKELVDTYTKDHPARYARGQQISALVNGNSLPL
jgi:hypothetical protein